MSNFEKSRAFEFSPSNEIIKKSIGWSTKSWFYTFKKVFNEFTLPKKIKVLELGAGEYSAISLLLLSKDTQLDVTTYKESKIAKVELLIDQINDIKSLKKYNCFMYVSKKNCWLLRCYNYEISFRGYF